MDKEKLKIERLLPLANPSDNAQIFALREFAVRVVKKTLLRSRTPAIAFATLSGVFTLCNVRFSRLYLIQLIQSRG